jgi:glycosyltransferase involved in cell wall biosynthesis
MGETRALECPSVPDKFGKSMNILKVVEACSAGVGRHVRSLCEDLVAPGHRLTVAYSPYRTDEAFERFVIGWRDRIRFVPIKVGRGVSPSSDSRAVVELLCLIRREGPFDVIHGHSSKGGAIARIAGRLCSIPTLYTPHSLILHSPEITKLEAAIYGSIERALGHWATAKIIAVSEDEGEFILEHRLVPDDRIVVIPNGIEDQDLPGFPEKVAYEDIEQKPLTFGAAMRFSAQKAPEDVIEAFIRLNSKLPQLPMRLVIVGDGELFSDVRRQVEESGLSDKISLLGWRSDVREVLHELDVFVVSSVYESGLSYAIMEAMAAKLPIVSTDVFGARGTLSKVPGNILVPTGNPDAIAEGMKRIATLAEPKSLRESLQSIGQDNHEYVRTHFRQSQVTRLVLQTYQEVCG